MIEVQDLTKNYGKVIGANHVNLVAAPGEITVLLGENGAGKSTTIKSITGLLKFTGRIAICGYDNRSVEAKRLFGYIPETPVLYDLLTVDEHIDFIGNAYLVPDFKAEADRLLDRFHLTEKRKTIAKELSKGMRQKLSMMLALVIRPRALLVDEPMMGLDPRSIEETLQLLVEMKHQDTSVLLSTHVIDLVDDIWDCAYIMKNGQVLGYVRRSQLLGKSLKEVFFEFDSEGATKAETAMQHAMQEVPDENAG